MKQIYLVTGNAKKLQEWQTIVADVIDMESVDLDLPEIQSDDTEEILIDKVKRAYEAVKKPVVVEDVSAGLDKFDGLPGPFIKYFNKRLGGDALYKLAGEQEANATVSCAVAYYDGTSLFTVSADLHGKVVTPRVGDGFGFDIVFVPEGESQTFAEMDPIKKNSLSHRSQAIKQFVQKLNEL